MAVNDSLLTVDYTLSSGKDEFISLFLWAKLAQLPLRISWILSDTAAQGRTGTWKVS